MEEQEDGRKPFGLTGLVMESKVVKDKTPEVEKEEEEIIVEIPKSEDPT